MSTLNDINNYPLNTIKHELFKQKYCAYAAAIYWNNKNNDRLESTDKIVLPPSALSKLSSLHILSSLNDAPIIFEIANNSHILPKKSHCSVIEFTANKGSAYLPIQIMDNLGLDYHGNDSIELTTVQLPKGQFIQVQPHKTQQIMSLSSIPKYVLEKHLTKYSCLTLGDTVQFEYKNVVCKFDITKIKPCIIQSTAPPAISIIECDIEVDFCEPRDYNEWKTVNDTSNSDHYLEEESKDESGNTEIMNNCNDEIESPDYFSIYGQNVSPTPETSQTSEESDTAFSFKDANKGFSFCDKKSSK